MHSVDCGTLGQPANLDKFPMVLICLVHNDEGSGQNAAHKSFAIILLHLFDPKGLEEK